jgi:L-amino acid N-acyltransferase YncA
MTAVSASQGLRTRAAMEADAAAVAFNDASRALCRRHGFREVGVYEKHAKLDGRWVDVVIVERLIPANLT